MKFDVFFYQDIYIYNKKEVLERKGGLDQNLLKK